VVQTRWLSVRNNWAAVIFLFRLAVVFLFNSSTYIKWRLLSSHLFPPAPLFFLSLLQCFIWIVSISWLIVLFLLLISLCIDGWLNQWINEWIEQWKNEPMNEWMTERMTLLCARMEWMTTLRIFFLLYQSSRTKVQFVGWIIRKDQNSASIQHRGVS